MRLFGPGSLGSGTRDGSKFLRDDGTWQVPSGGGGPAAQLDANGTTLDVNAIVDGEVLKRVGTTVVSVALPAAGAAASEPYVTIGNTAGLSAERALVGTAGEIVVTDGGANGNATLSAGTSLARVAGQLGGTAASPDVRGLRESGATLLTMGAVADGQMLVRSGTTVAGQAVPSSAAAHALAAAQSVAAGGSLYLVRYGEITAGQTFEIGADSDLEIG